MGAELSLAYVESMIEAVTEGKLLIHTLTGYGLVIICVAGYDGVWFHH